MVGRPVGRSHHEDRARCTRAGTRPRPRPTTSQTSPTAGERGQPRPTAGSRCCTARSSPLPDAWLGTDTAAVKARDRCGTPRSNRTTTPGRDRRSVVTRRSMSPSWAPGSPGSGRRTPSLARDPSLRVAVLERETASFGASGRNGGWCVGDQAAPLSALERAAGRAPPRAWCAPCKAASTSSATWSPPKGSTAASPRAVPSSSRRTPRSCSASRAVPPSTTAMDSTGRTNCGTRSAPVRSSVPKGSSARCTHPTRPRSTRPDSRAASPARRSAAA